MVFDFVAFPPRPYLCKKTSCYTEFKCAACVARDHETRKCHTVVDVQDSIRKIATIRNKNSCVFWVITFLSFEGLIFCLALCGLTAAHARTWCNPLIMLCQWLCTCPQKYKRILKCTYIICEVIWTHALLLLCSRKCPVYDKIKILHSNLVLHIIYDGKFVFNTKLRTCLLRLEECNLYLVRFDVHWPFTAFPFFCWVLKVYIIYINFFNLYDYSYWPCIDVGIHTSTRKIAT